MAPLPYPEQIDCVWVAADAAGNVGAFVTAGIGPIAATALDAKVPSIEDVGTQIDALPKVTTARMFKEDRGWGSFQTLAEAGIFAFDWQDVHRIRGFVRAYEAFAAPTEPVTLAKLPDAIGRAAAATTLRTVNFASASTVDVRALVTCVESALR